MYGRTFLHDADLDQQRALWLERVANVRLIAPRNEAPRDRFDRDERLLLSPLATQRYTSLILTRPLRSTPASARPRPAVAVEKRPLAAYAQLVGGTV